MAYGRIYGLECLVDGNKIYVGQTTLKLSRRISNHKCADSLIGDAIRKFGLENFVWVVLEECNSRAELNAAEEYWIARLNCVYPNGYNRNSGGKCLPNITAITREKHSKANKGKTRPVDQCVKTSASKRKVLYPVLDDELNRQQLTYHTLAERLGLKRETLSKKLNGTCQLDIDTAIAIKKFLGVDIPLEELFRKVEGNTAPRVEE